MKKIAFILFAVALFNGISFGQQNIQTAIDKSDGLSVKEWIQAGNDINGSITINGQNMTALSYASMKGNPEMVTLLLNRGALVNQKTDFQDALMFAAIGGNMEVIQKLIDAGANPMNENKMGKCARDIAKDNGNIEAQRYLASETERRIALQRAKRKK